MRHNELEGVGAVRHDQIDAALGAASTATAAANRGQWGWTDMPIAPDAFGLPASGAPSRATWKTNLYVWEFSGSQNNSIYFSVQLPHGYAAGKDIYAHVHFTPSAAPTAGQVVGWNIEYLASNPQGAIPASTSPLNLNYAFVASDAVDKHIMTADVVVAGSTFTASTILNCRLQRAGNTDTSNIAVILLGVDFHIPVNRFGSTNPSSG